jgi:hypothetical protein
LCTRRPWPRVLLRCVLQLWHRRRPLCSSAFARRRRTRAERRPARRSSRRRCDHPDHTPPTLGSPLSQNPNHTTLGSPLAHRLRRTAQVKKVVKKAVKKAAKMPVKGARPVVGAELKTGAGTTRSSPHRAVCCIYHHTPHTAVPYPTPPSHSSPQVRGRSARQSLSSPSATRTHQTTKRLTTTGPSRRVCTWRAHPYDACRQRNHADVWEVQCTCI